MMKTAKLGKMAFPYEPEHLDIHELPPITKEDAKVVLFKIQDCLASQGIEMYLAFGTLLGAVREKDFISGDLDVDVFVKDEKKLFNALPCLEQNGLKLIRQSKHIIYSFRDIVCQGCYIDVYILRPSYDIWGLYCYQLNGFRTPKKLIIESQEICFLGRRFLCPKDPQKLLEFWYGETWNIPISKSDKIYYYEVASHYYYKVFCARVKYYIKIILFWKYLRVHILPTYKNNLAYSLEQWNAYERMIKEMKL